MATLKARTALAVGGKPVKAGATFKVADDLVDELVAHNLAEPAPPVVDKPAEGGPREEGVMAARAIICTLWDGSRILRPIGLSLEAQQAACDAMTDDAVRGALRKLGLDDSAGTPEERRARLRAWPSPADLDAIAESYIALNGGVKPVIRVLEVAGIPSRRGPAGTTVH